MGGQGRDKARQFSEGVVSLKENALQFREQHRQAAKCKCEVVEALLVT